MDRHSLRSLDRGQSHSADIGTPMQRERSMRTMETDVPPIHSLFDKDKHQTDHYETVSDSTRLDGSILEVTVFGFQTGRASSVIDYFRQFGDFALTNPDGCNWCHLRFKNSVQAQMALSQSCRIIDGNMMIGVKAKDELPDLLASVPASTSESIFGLREKQASRVTPVIPYKKTFWRNIFDHIFNL